MYAHCYRSGEIELSHKSELSGAICIGEGRKADLVRRVEARARHAHDGKTLLVPGIPEAQTNVEAEQKMIEFRTFLAQ
ncbi:hypothetical protein [Pseudovibrio sp. POLY-S9]|uniref:hypothetical protein n=1 Tax=Pseudovibrio sp. POLY-S9 TaxID=1576596 RepID=UPI00070F8140|nr:hypothetical protein [Pseudovibrio sp. POLY-S9]